MLGICDACGYCNGFCDVFEAARRRPALSDADLAHLANLCHACRNCFHACQYAPPHPFAVNVPRRLASLRHQSDLDHLWPRALRGWARHPIATAFLILLAAMALVLGLVLAFVPPESLFASHRGAGAFYRVVPWWAMALLGLLPLGWSSLAILFGLRRYWRATRPRGRPITRRALARALRDILTLRNLRGGGPGCNDRDDRFSRSRRWLHQTMVLGMLLSLAATAVATLYHHLLDLEAPYPLLSPPVLLGTLGGIAMTIAALGLLRLKIGADPRPVAPETRGMELAALALLLLVALTGLLLLAARASPAMGLLLAIHLGSVLAFFLWLPYGKLVHAGYRSIALLIEAIERQERPRP